MTIIAANNRSLTSEAFDALVAASFSFCPEMRRFESEQGVNAEADQVLAFASFQRKLGTVRLGITDLRGSDLGGESVTLETLDLSASTVEDLRAAAERAAKAARHQALPSWAWTDGEMEFIDANPGRTVTTWGLIG